MGRFSVEMDVANYGDVVTAQRRQMGTGEVRRTTVQGLVDSGASSLVLPPHVVKKLGLPLADKVKVKYADGRIAKRDSVEGVYVDTGGRHGTFTAIVEPKRETALIGAIVLEVLDYLIDSRRHRLVPRDPDFVFSEIE